MKVSSIDVFKGNSAVGRKTSTEKFVLRTLCFKKKKSITNKRILTILSLDFLIVDRG